MPQWFGLAATTSRFLDFLVKFSLVFDVRIKNGYRWAIKGWKTASSQAKRASFFSSHMPGADPTASRVALENGQWLGMLPALSRTLIGIGGIR
jgi:hypothetical protein